MPLHAADLRAKLSLPVIASPLFIISNPELVIAQCKAGNGRFQAAVACSRCRGRGREYLRLAT